MSLHRLVLVTAVATTFSACSNENVPLSRPAPLSLAKSQAGSKAVFQPGDKLELYVEEDASFNGNYIVRPGGYILIPKIGRLKVEGLDRDGAEQLLTQTLQKNQLTKAKVLVEHVSGNYDRPGPPGVPKIMVFITGQVSRSGAHYLPVSDGKSIGLYETLLISGGLSKFAQLGKVEVFRSDSSGRRTRTMIDLRPIRDGLAEDPPVADGDIINVSEKVFGF
jgi:protein involved in polysaccharide export with SLBB domain